MPGPFYQSNLSSSLSPTVLMTGLPVQYYLCSIYLRPTNAALLSALTFTVSWNDGAARSHSEVCPLTALTFFKGTPFPIYMAANTDLVVDAVLTGLGSCEANLFILVQ